MSRWKRPPNLWPRYYALLDAARSASDAVDMFDLSGNPESSAQFNNLCRASDKAQLALIKFVLRNADDLARSFGGRIRETGQSDA